MPKLHEVLAIEKGERARVQKSLTDLHRAASTEGLYNGLARTYKPAVDGGEELPPESQIVQVRAVDALRKEADLLAPLWDIIAAKDWTNASGDAVANIVVDGDVLIDGVPVSYLLWLGKTLDDVSTFIAKIPTLDPSEKWHWNGDQNCYATEVAFTNRTKKVLRNHTKHPGSEHHPPQVETYTEDEVIGKFERIRYSGALPADLKEKLVGRVSALKNAVAQARERANSVEALRPEVGRKVFDFLLEPIQQ
jgi:hypothetical protein